MIDPDKITLSNADLRAVANFSSVCAETVLGIFERKFPDDNRARRAILAARTFASGSPRTRALREAAWSAQRASQVARNEGYEAASLTARAALAAAGSAFLHPIADAAQVKHILGSAAYALRANDLECMEHSDASKMLFDYMRDLATSSVVDVLKRYPPLPLSGSPVGALMHQLDQALRGIGKVSECGPRWRNPPISED